RTEPGRERRLRDDLIADTSFRRHTVSERCGRIRRIAAAADIMEGPSSWTVLLRPGDQNEKYQACAARVPAWDVCTGFCPGSRLSQQADTPRRGLSAWRRHRHRGPTAAERTCFAPEPDGDRGK